VLILQTGRIGDTVVSLPAFRAVRRHFGSAETWLLHQRKTDAVAAPTDVLVEGREIDAFIVSAPPGSSVIRRCLTAAALRRRIARMGFDAVVFAGLSETAGFRLRLYDLFFRLCRIPDRIGFVPFSRDELRPTRPDGHPAPVPHEAWFRLERLRRAGIDTSREDDLTRLSLFVPEREHAVADAWLAARRRRPGRPLVAICPGTSHPANAWPLDRFVELGRRLLGLERYELLVCGGRAERAAGARMVREWGEGVDATGALSVLQSAALLSRCRFMIGLDSGTIHLAAASGVPCVALYAERQHPGYWDPLGDRHVVLRHAVPCAGCRLERCAVGGHPCMTGITVDAVWDAVLGTVRATG
jgi:ADP-heptose:LPS heptosyltransferase